MALTPQTIIAGSKISFKAGGVPGTPATFAGGDVFGVVDKGSFEIATTEKELKGYKSGNPGLRVLADALVTETTTTIKFTLEEITQLAFDLGFALDSNGVIYAGQAQQKGWLKYEVFNGAVGVKVINAYGALSLDGNLDLGEEFVKPGFKFKVFNGTVADPV